MVGVLLDIALLCRVCALPDSAVRALFGERACGGASGRIIPSCHPQDIDVLQMVQTFLQSFVWLFAFIFVLLHPRNRTLFRLVQGNG